MRLVALAGVAVLAGCANPYAIPPPTRLVVVPMQPAMPRYDPPPVVFRPLPPPLPEERAPEPEPPVSVDVAPEPPSATVMEPLPSSPTPVAIQKAPVPDAGGAVPLMGFRPMKGQAPKGPGA